MAENEKSLGLHQRIPMDILLEALRAELNDEQDLERLSQLVNTEYLGENRQKKGFKQVKTTLTGNPLVSYAKERKEDVLAALKSVPDRNFILSAVMVARYPVCYDTYCLMAKQFRLQDEISRDLIIRMLGTKYGANKSVQNVQINVTAQMVECQLIKRLKTGTYVFADPQKPSCDITFELWKKSFFINNHLANEEDTDSLIFEPFFRYILL
ncbi:MAG: hypothetical protein J6N56_03065 [Bacteroidales bacterium]|nr:hypothetical protein [Bacteroidales bacterium]